MRVLILHDRVGPDARPDERDVLHQADAVEAALSELGHATERLPLGLDLAAAEATLRRTAPDVVFNLVESVGRQGRLAHLAPALLEAAGLSFTGCGSVGMLLAASKLTAKRVLAGAGLPTPAAWTLAELRAGAPIPPARYLLKSVWEHGSLGIDADAVVDSGDPAALASALERRLPLLGGDGFAETYVHGREFNLGLLEGAAGPECLPPAEIRFRGVPDGAPRVVGYRAKWAPGSAEDEGTPRAFDFAPGDGGLLAELRDLALGCWRQFELSGYARVDVRVDDGGRPWIVDVNTNPCLSPDAGYPAAIAAAGLTFPQAIGRLLAAAKGRGAGQGPPALRFELRVGDEERVRAIVGSTGFFTRDEIDIAVELVAERRARGDGSGYHFAFLEVGGAVLGYACWGPIPGTDASYDVYWVAVEQRARGRGFGKQLMRAAEVDIARRRGTRVYVDTSSKPQYVPTRAFYESCGYEVVAELPDFYRPGDGKRIYGKVVR